ncbi:hypothetical protein ACFY4K_11300 [Streptomyces leeuwenhoekii]|jgi:hypothetical protein
MPAPARQDESAIAAPRAATPADHPGRRRAPAGVLDVPVALLA